MEHNTTKKYFYIKIFFKVFLLAFVSAVLLLYINKYLYKSKATQPGLTVSFTPQIFSATINTDSNLNVVLNPNDAGNKISAFDLYFVPGGNLNIVSFGTPVSVGGGAGVQFNQQINSNNRLSYTISGNDSDLPLRVEIPMVVKAAIAGTGTLTVDTGANKSIVVGPIANYSYDLGTVPGSYTFTSSDAPTNTPIPTATTAPGAPTNTPVPTGMVSVNLNLKLKFQGISSKRPTNDLNKMVVKFTLYDENTGQNADYDYSAVTSDENGIWSGISDLTVNPGHKFTLLVKGPYHLQKKICDAVPTETAGGTYRCSKGNITLVAGNNDLDLSGIISLAGDLPEQDGTVTAYDTSLIYNNLGKNNDKCDVNRDGICDTQDFSLVIAALTVKNDEL